MNLHLNRLRCLQGLFWWDPNLSFSENLLYKVCDVTSCDGNVFDTAANDIAFGLRKGKTTFF